MAALDTTAEGGEGSSDIDYAALLKISLKQQDLLKIANAVQEICGETLESLLEYSRDDILELVKEEIHNCDNNNYSFKTSERNKFAKTVVSIGNKMKSARSNTPSQSKMKLLIIGKDEEEAIDAVQNGSKLVNEEIKQMKQFFVDLKRNTDTVKQKLKENCNLLKQMIDQEEKELSCVIDAFGKYHETQLNQRNEATINCAKIINKHHSEHTEYFSDDKLTKEERKQKLINAQQMVNEQVSILKKYQNPSFKIDINTDQNMVTQALRKCFSITHIGVDPSQLNIDTDRYNVFQSGKVQVSKVEIEQKTDDTSVFKANCANRNRITISNNGRTASYTDSKGDNCMTAILIGDYIKLSDAKKVQISLKIQKYNGHIPIGLVSKKFVHWVVGNSVWDLCGNCIMYYGDKDFRASSEFPTNNGKRLQYGQGCILNLEIDCRTKIGKCWVKSQNNNICEFALCEEFAIAVAFANTGSVLEIVEFDARLSAMTMTSSINRKFVGWDSSFGFQSNSANRITVTNNGRTAGYTNGKGDANAKKMAVVLIGPFMKLTDAKRIKLALRVDSKVGYTPIGVVSKGFDFWEPQDGLWGLGGKCIMYYDDSDFRASAEFAQNNGLRMTHCQVNDVVHMEIDCKSAKAKCWVETKKNIVCEFILCQEFAIAVAFEYVGCQMSIVSFEVQN